MKNRVHYIDNLRWMTISLLVIFHAAMAYNTWGEANYIFFKEVKPIAAIVTFISPWFMPLLFFLAGISAKYSLEKRGVKRFIKERIYRLGVPLVIGIAAICTILSYIADVTHNFYKGNYFEHYKVFFTKYTDLTGYDGGFTFGHLWFLAVLIVVSLISCMITKPVRYLPVVLYVLAVSCFDFKISGKPLLTYLFVYMLGYHLSGKKDFVKKAVKYKWIFVAVFITALAANTVLFIYIKDYETLNNICNYASFAAGLPALVLIGHDHLDFRNRITEVFSAISYHFYILHFPVVVISQYLLNRAGLNIYMNFLLTLMISYPLTYFICLAVNRKKIKKIARANDERCAGYKKSI